MKNELITLEVNPTLPVIEGNFDAVKAQIKQELTKYENYLVTVDTLKEDKSLAASIKKMGSDIDTLRKEHKATLSAPIQKFESEMNELKNLYLSVYTKIIDQTKAFEEEKKAEIQVMMNEYLEKLYEDHDIREPFRTAKIEGTAKLTNITKNGALNKSAKDAITAEFNICAAKQAKIDKRLMELENLCYKAGLSEPLQSHHVQGFLFSDNDEVYNQQLADLIEAEVERNNRIQEQARLKAEQEAQRSAKLQAEQQQQAQTIEQGKEQIAESMRQHWPEDNQRINHIGQNGNDGQHYQEQTGYAGVDQGYHAEPEPEQQVDKNGTAVFSVTCKFKVVAPNVVTPEQVESKFRTMLTKAGFTTLESIEVWK